MGCHGEPQACPEFIEGNHGALGTPMSIGGMVMFMKAK